MIDIGEQTPGMGRSVAQLLEEQAAGLVGRADEWAILNLLLGEGGPLVVFVHGREVGPKSIHKEARFLIDHAPCSVLVVKG